jgi:hypothetical protein
MLHPQGKKERGLAPRFGEGVNLGKQKTPRTVLSYFWFMFSTIDKIFMIWLHPLVHTFTSLATPLPYGVFVMRKQLGQTSFNFLHSSSLAIFHPLWTLKVHQFIGLNLITLLGCSKPISSNLRDSMYLVDEANLSTHPL